MEMGVITINIQRPPFGFDGLNRFNLGPTANRLSD